MIDAHALVFANDQDHYPALTALTESELSQSRTASQLLACMQEERIDRSILVQRQTHYGFDNRYVCDMAGRHRERLTAVCAVDGRLPDAAAWLRHWVRQHGAGGLRFMEPERGQGLSWLNGPHAREVWREAAELGIPVDVHVFRWNRVEGLQALGELLREFPVASVVINNLGNIDPLTGLPNQGLDAPVLAFAECPEVYLKFTTIPLGPLDSAGQRAVPLIERLVAVFGARRLMWGSDVPLGGRSYPQMVQLAREATATLSPADREDLLDGTARKVYLRDGSP